MKCKNTRCGTTDPYKMAIFPYYLQKPKNPHCGNLKTFCDVICGFAGSRFAIHQHLREWSYPARLLSTVPCSI